MKYSTRKINPPDITGEPVSQGLRNHPALLRLQDHLRQVNGPFPWQGFKRKRL